MTGETRTRQAQLQAAAARAQLVDTLSRIQHRLSPRTMAGEAWESVRGRTEEIARLVMPLRAVRTSRLSLALTLSNVLMKQLRNRKGRSGVSSISRSGSSTSHAHDGGPQMTLKDKARSTRDYAGEKAHAAREYATDAAGTARGKLGVARDAAAEQMHNARDYAGNIYHGAQDKARSARERLTNDVDTNPILALMGGIAAGALIGLLLPRTRREVERLGTVGSNIGSKARNLAQAARDAGRDALQEAGLTRDAAAQTARDVAERARQAATLAADRAVKQVKGQNIDA